MGELQEAVVVADVEGIREQAKLGYEGRRLKYYVALFCWATVFFVNPFHVFASSQLNNINGKSERWIAGLQQDTKFHQLRSQLSNAPRGRQCCGFCVKPVHELLGALTRSASKFVDDFIVADTSVAAIGWTINWFGQNAGLLTGYKKGSVVQQVHAFGGETTPTVGRNKHATSKHWLWLVPSLHSADYFQVAVFESHFRRPVLYHPSNQFVRTKFLQPVLLPDVSSNIVRGPLTLSIAHSASKDEHYFVAQCGDFALRVYIFPGVRVPASTVHSYGEFIMREVEVPSGAGLNLGPCYAPTANEDEEQEGQFHIKLQSSEGGLSLYSLHTWTFLGHKTLISWDGRKWFEIIARVATVSRRLAEARCS